MHVHTFATAVILGLTGCGTIFTPNDTLVTFTSEPDGAEVRLDGLPIGRTPVQTWVSNRRDILVTMQHDDGGAATCFLDASIGAGWLVLDILFGLVPVVVDAVTGGWNTLDRAGCHAIFGTSRQVPQPGPVSSSQ